MEGQATKVDGLSYGKSNVFSYDEPNSEPYNGTCLHCCAVMFIDINICTCKLL